MSKALALLFGLIIGSLMFAGVGSSPIHQACALLDPPSDLEVWKHTPAQ